MAPGTRSAAWIESASAASGVDRRSRRIAFFDWSPIVLLPPTAELAGTIQDHASGYRRHPRRRTLRASSGGADQPRPRHRARFRQIGARGRNRTGMTSRPGDFKSPVSTSFTTRAHRGPAHRMIDAAGCAVTSSAMHEPSWAAEAQAGSRPNAPRHEALGILDVEARPGIEPRYAALQAAASPLCHLADDDVWNQSTANRP